MQPHDVLKITLALLAVVAMIMLVRYAGRLLPLARRDRASALLRLEASLPIDQKRRLCLVSCQDHKLLLLVGGASDVMLGWLPAGGPADRLT